MSMSVGPPSGSEEPGVMANINTTPLVDVMLVLLIIFLITIPVINKTVKVDLPKAVNIPTQTKPENITVAVDKNGNIYWNDKSMPTKDDLLAYVKAAAVEKPWWDWRGALGQMRSARAASFPGPAPHTSWTSSFSFLRPRRARP